MLSEYRQRFGEFHIQLGRDDYLVRAGFKACGESDYFHREYADLFSKEQIAELRRLREESSVDRETDRASLGRLIAFAEEARIERSAANVWREIESYEQGQRILWRDQTLTLESAHAQLAEETDAARRRDLFLRWTDRIEGADDLRAERLEKIHSAVKEAGFDHPFAMRTELREIDLPGLCAKARRLLSLSEKAFSGRLSQLLPRATGVSFGETTEADLPRFLRFTEYDPIFSRDRMAGIYRELFRRFGFDPSGQNNLTLDAEPRARKREQAFCAPIAVPDEIKLSYLAAGGQENYREFLREGGQAQNFAWTSRNLPPEFRIVTRWSDRAVRESWGLLIESLMVDPRWLLDAFNFLESAEYIERLSCAKLLSLRWNAALFLYEADVYAGGSVANAAHYQETMSDAVRVGIDASGHLRILDEFLLSADRLRACAFESQLRDYLKTRYGARWWTSRKAGEMLIDLWNTGQQYSVETLARMIGLGELDFEWLAAEAVRFQ